MSEFGWALSKQEGIAFAYAGLAETLTYGIAASFSAASTEGGIRGISIAGPGGIAVAFDEDGLVQAGKGGALAGYQKTKGQVRLVIQAVSDTSENRPGELYRFANGRFLSLSKTQRKQADADIAAWRGVWGKS